MDWHKRPERRVSLFERGLTISHAARRRWHVFFMLAFLIPFGLYVTALAFYGRWLSGLKSASDLWAFSVLLAFGIAVFFIALPRSIVWLRRNRHREYGEQLARKR